MANGPTDFDNFQGTLQEYVKLKAQLLSVENDLSSERDKQLATQQAELAIQKELLAITAQGQQAVADEASRLRAMLDDEKQLVELSTADVKFATDKLELLLKMQNASDEELALLKEQLQVLVKQGNQIVKNASATQKATDKLAALLGVGMEFEDTMTGAFSSMVGGGEDLFNSLKKSFSPSKLGGFIANGMEELAFKTDKLTSSFVKGSGATPGLAGSVEDSADSLRMMGLGMDSAFEAAGALLDGITAFQTGTAGARRELATFFGVMVKGGISGPGATKVFQVFNKSLDMSMQASLRATTGLVQFGRALNMDVNRFISDFNTLAPTLLAHGDNMEKVFKELAVTSQQTGIAMGNLMGVAQQFDTFESAAQSTARLNSILGGAYLNSVEMVFATESERLDTLHRTLELSGKTFNSLGRFEKKALTSAAGFSSVGEAASFFNTSLEVNNAKMEEQAKRQDTMADLARRSSDIMEELSMTMQQLFVNMAPVVEVFSDFVKGVSTFIGLGDGFVGKLILVSIGFIKISKSIRALAVSTGLLKAAQGTVGGDFMGPRLPGGATTRAAGGMLPRGLAMLSRFGTLGLGLAALGGVGYGLYSAFGGGGDSGAEEVGFKSYQSGRRPGDTAGPTIARVHRGETVLLPPSAGVVTAGMSAGLATRNDMSNIATAITNGLAAIAGKQGGDMILDGKVLGQFVEKKQSNQLSIFDTTN